MTSDAGFCCVASFGPTLRLPRRTAPTRNRHEGIPRKDPEAFMSPRGPEVIRLFDSEHQAFRRRGACNGRCTRATNLHYDAMDANSGTADQTGTTGTSSNPNHFAPDKLAYTAGEGAAASTAARRGDFDAGGLAQKWTSSASEKEATSCTPIRRATHTNLNRRKPSCRCQQPDAPTGHTPKSPKPCPADCPPRKYATEAAPDRNKCRMMGPRVDRQIHIMASLSS